MLKTVSWLHSPNNKRYLDEDDLASAKMTLRFMTEATATLLPNTYYKWGEVAALNLTLGAAVAGFVNEYCFEFQSPASGTPTVLTMVDTISWVSLPVIQLGKTYQVSIVNGIGVMVYA